MTVEDWAEIRRLHRAEGMPIKVIARAMGCSKNTVRRRCASDAPPKYERPARGSVVDEVEPRIRELLRAWPTMPATVIAERIGWEHSIRMLRGPGRGCCGRPICRRTRRRARPMSRARSAQCDFWFPDGRAPVGFGQTRTATSCRCW